MGNCISKALEGDNAIEIIKKVYQSLFVFFLMLDDINELCKKYP